MQKKIIFVMGVSGSGKTTIGKMLAQKLGLPFFDGDDYHPVENVVKMKSGAPLTDEDRYPWLKKLNGVASESMHKDGCIIACSALKETYRKILAEGIEDHVKWIFLSGAFDLIKERLENRSGHYMKAAMLKSQFDTLEPPEYSLLVSIDDKPENIVNKIMTQLEY